MLWYPVQMPSLGLTDPCPSAGNISQDNLHLHSLLDIALGPREMPCPLVFHDSVLFPLTLCHSFHPSLQRFACVRGGHASSLPFLPTPLSHRTGILIHKWCAGRVSHGLTTSFAWSAGSQLMNFVCLFLAYPLCSSEFRMRPIRQPCPACAQRPLRPVGVTDMEPNMWGQVSSVQSLSCVRLFATPWIAARQASLSITDSRSSPKLMSIESVMPSNHLILRVPLLLPPSIFPSIRVFPNESVLRIRWPKYWSFK